MGGGGHKRANPKSGGKGKKLRGDKKQEDIFGHKGIGKKQREKSPLKKIIKSIVDLEPSELIESEYKMLYELSDCGIYIKQKAIEFKYLCNSRKIPHEDRRGVYNDFKRKMEERGWVVFEEVFPDQDVNEVTVYLKLNKRDQIRAYLKNYENVMI